MPATLSPSPWSRLRCASRPCAWLWACFILLLAPHVLADGGKAKGAKASAKARLAEGRAAFDAGDCALATTTLAPLAVPGQLAFDDTQLDVHRMLGVCYALSGQATEAAREFGSLLALNPDYDLDPIVTPPTAVAVFAEQKARMQAQLEELRRAREDEERAGLNIDGGVLVETTEVVSEVPMASMFLPFGVAQGINGDVTKAILVGAAQAVFLGLNVSAYWGLQYVKSSPITTQDALQTQTVLWSVHLAALAGALVAYGVGVGDALVSRQSAAVVKRQKTRRALTPGELKTLNRIQKAEPQKP